MKNEITGIKTLGLAGSFLIMLCLLMPADASAGIAVSPLQQWVEVKPGGQVEFSVTINNVKRTENAPPETVHVRLVDFSVSEDGQLSFHGRLDHPRSAADWITLNDGEFKLKPGESRTISGTVSAPISAGGDYWAAVIVTMGSPRKNKDGVRVVLRTASGIFVHVARRNYLARSKVTETQVDVPSPAPDGDTGEAEAEDKSNRQDDKQPVLRIDAAVKNDGKVAFSGKATAHLYDDNRRRIASIPMHAPRKRLLPGHVRRFQGVMAMPLPAGSYRLRIICEAADRHGRKPMVERQIEISPAAAEHWSRPTRSGHAAGGHLRTDPEKLQIELTPGRFSMGQLKIKNQGLGTISVDCELQADSMLSGWLDLSSDEFTLPPRMTRNLGCSFAIPRDAAPGRYEGSLMLHVESPTATGKDAAHSVPVVVRIRKAGDKS